MGSTPDDREEGDPGDAGARPGPEAGAFAAFVRRHDRRLMRFVRVCLGPELRTKLVAEDIVRAALHAVAREVDITRPRDDELVMRRLAEHAEHEIRRAATRYWAAHREGTEEIDEQPASPDFSDPGVEIIEPILDEIPVQGRVVILWRLFLGATWEEVAERAGCRSELAARTLYERMVHRVAKDLRGSREAMNALGGRLLEDALQDFQSNVAHRAMTGGADRVQRQRRRASLGRRAVPFRRIEGLLTLAAGDLTWANEKLDAAGEHLARTLRRRHG